MVAMDDERPVDSRSQNGDHEAFESLIQSYQRMIHSLAYRHDRLACDAQNLAQEPSFSLSAD